MKALILSTLAALTFAVQAHAAATMTLKGRVHKSTNCVETSLELARKGHPSICLGVDGVQKSELAAGLEYELKGYKTEDGFFVQSAAITGSVDGKIETDSQDSKHLSIRTQIRGSVAKAIYQQLRVEEVTARGPGGGQQQKLGEGFTCINDPVQSYVCVLDFGPNGLE